MKRELKWTILATSLVATFAGGFVVSRAWAGGVPATGALTYTGALQNADGSGVTGSHNIGVKLWGAASGGTTPLCDVTQSATDLSATHGRFTVPLLDACATQMRANANTWVEILVDGTSLGRTHVGAVPYSLESAHATASDTALTATNATSATTAATANAAAGALATTITGLTSEVNGLKGRVDLKVFEKGGNNGTSSCDAFCAGSLWGKVGTCVAANLTGEHIPCSTNLGIANASIGKCWCAAP